MKKIFLILVLSTLILGIFPDVATADSFSPETRALAIDTVPAKSVQVSANGVDGVAVTIAMHQIQHSIAIYQD